MGRTRRTLRRTRLPGAGTCARCDAGREGAGYGKGHVMNSVIDYFLERHGSRRSFVGSVATLGLGVAGIATTGQARALAAMGAQSAVRLDGASTYLFAHIKLKPGTIKKFTAALGEVAPLFEKHGGWKLQACFLEDDGGEDTVIDVWEIPNAEAVEKNLAAAPNDLAFQELRPRFGECVETETLHVMNRQPVAMA